jgi:hypothetical protein
MFLDEQDKKTVGAVTANAGPFPAQDSHKFKLKMAITWQSVVALMVTLEND